MSRIYHHLSPEERAVIMIEHQNGSSLRSIARRLGRSPSTLSRELRRMKYSTKAISPQVRLAMLMMERGSSAFMGLMRADLEN